MPCRFSFMAMENSTLSIFTNIRVLREGRGVSIYVSIYINGLAKTWQTQKSNGYFSQMTCCCCLQGLQQQLDLLHKFPQTWALNKTKIIFKKKKRSSHQNLSFFLNTNPLEQTKNYTFLGRNISSRGNYNQAVKDMRRAFYAIKIDIPTKTWLNARL